MFIAPNNRLNASLIRTANQIKKQLRAGLTLCALVLALYVYVFEQDPSSPAPARETPDLATEIPSLIDGRQVESAGTVVRILSDDNHGSRHQRFILELANGQTLLIAHNIDLAPRINNIDVGDIVAFYGQYESNDRGGVVHWTHHDPQGQHVGGWLRHQGKVYE